MDDAFMSEVPDGQNEIVELILRIILGRDDLRVTSVETQREYKSHTMRSIRLDVKAVDAAGRSMTSRSSGQTEALARAVRGFTA